LLKGTLIMSKYLFSHHRKSLVAVMAGFSMLLPLSSANAQSADGEVFTVYADEATSGWPLWDCCGGSTPTVEMDDADHGNVAEFSVLGNPATVQGFDSRDDGVPFAASATGVFSFEMKVVTAAAAGTPWNLKMESTGDPNTGDINLNTSKEGIDPVAGQWQTYSFDVSTLASAGLDISAIDVIMMFPTWGQGAGAVYRIDNVQFTAEGGSTGDGGGGGSNTSPTSGGDLVIDIANGIDFEGDETAQAEWDAFENGDPSAPLAFVTNPNMVDNTTNGVAKLTPLVTGGKYAGVVTHTVQSFALSESNALVKIWVHKDKISPVGVKFEKFNGDGYGSQGELTATNTLINQWEQLSIDFSSQIGLPETDAITGVAIFPDMVDGRTADTDVYFDEITFNSTSDLPETPSGLTVFGDEAKDGWPLWDCCAGSTPLVVMDDADHGNVAEFSVLGAPETVQGFDSRDTGMPYDASGDETFSFELKVVTAPADGTPWLAKVEAAGSFAEVNLNTSIEGVDPVVGQWQTYTFDVATLAAAGLDITKIDVVLVFPAWGAGAGAVYRVDNVLFGAGDPTTEPGPDPTLYSGQMYILPDTNDDGISELGIMTVNTTESTVTLAILSGKDRTDLNEVVWVDKYADASISLHVMPDMNDNGVDDIALFGIQDTEGNEGRAQAFVRDLMTGNKVGATVNWVANWTDITPIIIDDMNGDSLSEIAIQGRFKDGNRPQLVVKAGGTNTIIDTYSYPDLFVSPQYNQHSDINGDGFPEISTFGVLSKNNKIQVKIASGIDAGTKLPAYNFPDKWDNISWHRLGDSNADGQDDWGIFGTLKEDGRPQLVNKDGVSPVGVLRIFAWPAEIQDAKFFLIPDMNNDGVQEVAAAGVRSNNGRFQFQVQDGTDRNMVLANHNLNLNLESVTYHVLPDLNGDEMAEIGFLGMNASGEYELIIRHGDTANGEYSANNLGNDWQSAPYVTSLGDTDDSGSPNIIVYGQNANGDQLVITDL
jgi:hypothetical protein